MSDYYKYTGTTPEGLAVNVVYYGYTERPEESHTGTHIFDISCVDTEDVDSKIREMVLSGEISLTYTGGWRPGCFIWDAKGNRKEVLGCGL